MDQLTQEHRLISVSSPLGKDALLLTSFKGGEFISQLFEFQLDVLSANHEIKANDIVGKKVTVKIGEDDKPRYFNGYVNHFTFGEIEAKNLRQYSLTVVPWFWFLTQTQNRRIYQEMSTKEIVTDIFKEYNFNDFKFKASVNNKRDYCVQYGESDFHFISRLLEEEGISYYFEQEKDKHILVLVDQLNSFDYCEEKDVGYSKGNPSEAQITEWDHNYEFRSGKWTVNDFDFTRPDTKQIKSEKTSIKFSGIKNYEQYEYPAYYTVDSLKEVAKIRMQAEEFEIDSATGSSDCSSFYAGGKFKLTKHTAKSEKGEYILTAVYHHSTDNSYFSGGEGGSHYNNHFVCVPADVHIRPTRIHPKPIMQGPQSAIVTGQSGEEIYIDDYGRIKVKFIWDRGDTKNEKTSCYLRVMQPWAGDGWGVSFIPRIGQEVIVNFLDGDPDRPIVTGSVYNGKHKIPYKNKTQSGIKTNSTKGGSTSNYNEIRFDDLKGSEEFYVQAEKDFKQYVKHDQEIKIVNNHDRIIEKGNETIKVSKGDRTVNVKKTIKQDASDIVITGKKSIELKVGGSSIKMTSTGIEIKSTKIDVKGSAMVSIKGGITKIN